MIISGICYSFKGTWTAFVGNSSVSDIMLTVIRLTYSVLVSGTILLFKKPDMSLTKKQTGTCIVFGISGTALTICLMSMAVQQMSSGFATMCNYAYPILVSLASLVLYKERFGRLKILASLFMLSGLFLCNCGGTMTLYGTFLGLGSAITFGLYVFGQEHSPMIEVEPLKLFFYNSLFGLITAIGIATVTGPFMFVTDIRTHVFMFMGVRKVGASKTAFLSVLEPGLSFVWDILFFWYKIQYGKSVRYSSYFRLFYNYGL